VLVTDDLVGSHGTVQFSRGLIEQLNKVSASFLDQDAALDTKLSGLQKRVTEIGKQRAILATKMTALEQRLFKQFNAMDKLVGSMQNTASFLTQQFSPTSKSK
jgi:flagellar hook-associated protein 2